jgi:oligoendopeptidase F
MDETDIFSELSLQSDESFEKILRALMESKDIELKTEIINPLAMAKLKAFGKYMGQKKYVKCEAFIDSFIEALNKYMVSNDREGRREIIQAISEVKKKTESVTEKLTTPP